MGSSYPLCDNIVDKLPRLRAETRGAVSLAHSQDPPERMP
jgi:hypothetical protein